MICTGCGKDNEFTKEVGSLKSSSPGPESVEAFSLCYGCGRTHGIEMTAYGPIQTELSDGARAELDALPEVQKLKANLAFYRGIVTGFGINGMFN